MPIPMDSKPDLVTRPLAPGELSGIDQLDAEIAQLEKEAAPQAGSRVAALVRTFDGTNDIEIAKKIVSLLYSGDELG